MPVAPKNACRFPGCRALASRPGYCEAHRRESHSRYHAGSQQHKLNNRFYAGVKWRKVRSLHLQAEPLCRHCRKAGKLTEATHVDHIIPRSKSGPDFDSENLQSLCKPCHEAKSRRDEAGGRVKSL